MSRISKATMLLKKYLLEHPSDAKLSEIKQLLDEAALLDIEKIGDYLPDSIIIFDHNGKILYLNKANEDLLSIPREAALGKNASEFVSENNTQLHNATTLHVLNTQETYASISIPTRTERPLLEMGVPILDDNGDLEGVVLVDKDITEFLETKAQLELSEQKVRRHKDIKDNPEPLLPSREEYTTSQTKFICECPQMKQAFKRAVDAAKTDAPVLIVGETGTGKEIFADLIHQNSLRADKPFFKVNCAAIPEHLFESELFGYEKGAFTGANQNGKPGYFSLANGGTLMLDEIGEIPLGMQAKLLRALQQKQIIRVGGTKPIDVDIRIIASTNRDLKKMIQEGTFRSDLYYRINIIKIRIPPLRERKEDLPVLIRTFLEEFNKKYNKCVTLMPSVYMNMAKYHFPGNVRELANLIERWVISFDEHAMIRWDQLDFDYWYPDQNSGKEGDTSEVITTVPSMREMVDDYKREILIWARDHCHSSREMASYLQVDHSTILKLAKKLHVDLRLEERKKP